MSETYVVDWVEVLKTCELKHFCNLDHKDCGDLARYIEKKDQEINALQIAHVNQESDNMVLRKYLKEVYDVLDRYQAFQLSGKTEEERAKETSTKGGNER